MNKKVVIIAAVLILLVLGVAGFLIAKNKPASPSISATATNVEPTKANVISSIKDALAGSMSISCDYTDQTGRKITSYIKSGQIRVDVVASDPQQSGSTIIKDQKMYFWNDKGGMMMAIPTGMMQNITMAPTQKTSAAAATGDNSQQLVDSMEQYKQYCHQASVDDSKFVVPTDVKFQDMSTMMKQAAPSGTMAAPSGMTQAQMDEMIRYAPPAK